MEILQIIITGIFSLIVALVSVWLKHHLDSKKKIKDDEHYESLSNNDIDTMLEIQKFLDEFRKKWNLDRIGIFQFHNGGKFFNGVPMKKYSQSFESVASGISSIKQLNQTILVTEHPGLMKGLNEKDFFDIDCSDPCLDYIRGKLEQAGILQIINSPIRTLSGQLIGFLQIQCVKNKINISKELEEEIEDLVSNISGYLIRKNK